MVASAASSDRNSNQQQPPSSPSTSSSPIDFFDIPSFHTDPLPLCQPTFPWDSDSSSTVSDFSLSSTTSLFSETSTSLLAPETPTIPTVGDRRAANPGTLNAEWQTFFRRSLVAEDPNRAMAPPDAGQANANFMQPAIREQYTAIFKAHFGQARVITATMCGPKHLETRRRGVGYPGILGTTRFESVS
jgi:hypothetical protein